MKPLDFLFAVAQKFSPVTEAEMGEIRKEANLWHTETISNPDTGPGQWRKWYGQISLLWFTRLALCYVYIFTIRAIGGWMQEVNNPNQGNFPNQQNNAQNRW